MVQTTKPDEFTADSRAAELIREAWNYPLFDAIFQRRSRRFPVGAELPEGGLTPFKSQSPPQPLDSKEEAMLLLAGTGRSGLNYAEFPYMDADGKSLSGNTMIQFTGRTYASPCGSHGTEMFFTNDSGVFAVPMREKPAERLMEIDSESSALTAIEGYGSDTNVVRLSDERLDLNPLAVSGNNQWNVNQPGTTLFMPVTDVTWEYINVVMTFLDHPKRLYLYDDINGNAEPLREYAAAGLLDRNKAYPLSEFERMISLATTGVEQAFMCQNMFLALQAIGLGGWILGASPPRIVLGATPLMKGFGFRSHTKEGDSPIKPLLGGEETLPIGIDGVFQSYVPPYHASMADAVEAVYRAKWGTEGIYDTARNAFAPTVDLNRVPKTENWALQAAKDWCQYLWDTYGRFPVTIDPMQMNIWFQAHHLETGYYDEHFEPGTYHERIRDHQATWHGE